MTNEDSDPIWIGGVSFSDSLMIYSEKVGAIGKYDTQKKEAVVKLYGLYSLPITKFNIKAIDLRFWLILGLAYTVLAIIYFLIYWVWLCYLVIGLIPKIHLLVDIVCMRKSKLAEWHGAEHKVIENYLKTGSTDLASTKAASPISNFCGIRIETASLIIYALFYFMIFLFLDIPPELGLFLLAYLLEFVAKFISHNFYNSYPAIWSGQLLQRLFTVREPAEYQLLTAHYTLLVVLMTHYKIQELPPHSMTLGDDREGSITYRFPIPNPPL